MGKETNVLKSLEESSVSRRSFLKGTAALGAMAAMYGCSKDGGSEIIYGGGCLWAVHHTTAVVVHAELLPM